MTMLLNELMLNILFGVSFALIKHYDQHANREGKGLFSLHIHSRRAGNLGSGDDAKIIEESCLLTCFPWLLQCGFLESPDLSKQEWHHPPWTGSSTIDR